VAASADAVFFPTGTGKCVKPFAIPEPPVPFSFPVDDGMKILVWKKQDPETRLIGDMSGTNSGAVIRDITRSPNCMGGALVSVNQGVASDVPGEKVGPVQQGIDDMVALDPNLLYNEATGQFTRNGAVVTDWRSSPRVANVVLWDRETSTAKVVRVADVVTIYFLKSEGSGNNAQAWGHVFRSLGIADNCAATDTCSNSTMYLRLVR
jgi:hypothetical protein